MMPPAVMPLPSSTPSRPPAWSSSSGNSHPFWNPTPTQNEIPTIALLR